jgi:hypothetical protein
MKASVIAALCLACAAAGCGDEENRANATCERFCAAQDAAGCAQGSNPECAFACTLLWNGNLCRADWRALITCEADATWTCDAGTGYPLVDRCQEEAMAFLACADAQP